jgi:hypothetical protein
MKQPYAHSPLRDSDTGVRQKPVVMHQEWKTPWLFSQPSWHPGAPHHWFQDLPEIFRDRYELNCLNSRRVRTVLDTVSKHGDRIEDVRLVYDFFTFMRDAFTPYGKEEIDANMRGLCDRLWPTRELFAEAPLHAFKTLGGHLAEKTWPKSVCGTSLVVGRSLLPDYVFNDYMMRLANRGDLEPDLAFNAFLVLLSHRYAYPAGSLGPEVSDCVIDAVDEVGWTDASLRHLWRFLETNQVSFDPAAIGRLGAFFMVVRKISELPRQRAMGFGGSSPAGAMNMGGNMPGDAGSLVGSMSAAGTVAADGGAAVAFAERALQVASVGAIQVFAASASAMIL